MSSIELCSTHRLSTLIVIRILSAALIIYTKLFMNIFVLCLKILFYLILNIFFKCLPIINHLIKCHAPYIQSIFDIITGVHHNLFNVTDGDFRFGATASRLFRQNNNKDYNNPDIHDVFHIYLSKLLYESRDTIIEQCKNWGFNEDSIQILSYIQPKDLNKYSYSIKAVVINHHESNTIIIALQGREPMNLLQWLTNGETDFIDINNVFNNNNDDPIRVHTEFYSALGLNAFNPSQPIDFSEVNSESPIFMQLLKSLQKIHQNNNEYKISITGHSLGGGLASLFSFILLCYGYESSIFGVYTYGQPLVGNHGYAQILNDKIGNRFHRWVNHSDIVIRFPFIELSSLAWDYNRRIYTDAFVAEKHIETNSNMFRKYYYHSGLRFKINRERNLERHNEVDKGPILAQQDKCDLFLFIYSLEELFDSFFNISKLRSILWLFIPAQINDHFPGDYARKIKRIVRDNCKTSQ